ncbi:MAG TPA: polyphenol oxidase family protein [Bdellovibrionota bacterium]|nr:polyphenol oxidase family protein [Bdellovibrionota bacterium]
MNAIQSALLSKIAGLRHGFGTRHEPIPHAVADLWLERRPKWRQVHGAQVTEAREPHQELGDCDGIWSSAHQIPVAVQTADCVPLLFARDDGSRFAAVHAGWRGTYQEIAAAASNAMGCEKELDRWRVAIGPAIRGCCYEVSPELVAQFREKFGHLGADKFLTGPRHLDIQEINRLQLARLGFLHVEVIALCTRCTRDPDDSTRLAFFSHRHKPGEGRQWAAICRR